ncbi:MerR family transcriptional regulator [Desulfoprunum benzoelyticum]|uniref:MerR family transcriptional regulator/heat shock protein HspR n=1 Tax=Desulfoprunum benzoelyticum TaxID=1506996 RepID=A0A840V3G2_9BACT|nr:MerR family transcriptional regulator [Desulfoprunum benzoelyticum]MBB5347671.1 MerR family transcriptional regulator/heat shock protein HspR [Desulfoprunum benzoelyticum]MBM9529201.1 MerR family transcriptional regulator [Desulfoprunum benzoelyticum]
MTKKKSRVEPIRNDLPVYPIGVASRLLNVHPRTLRIYEDEGLLKPERVGDRRLYSQNDITWIGCLRSLIHDEGISIPGIKKLLQFASCYEITGCPRETWCNCDAVVDRALPRSLRVAGDPAAEMAARQKERVEREKEQQEASAAKPEAERKAR